MGNGKNPSRQVCKRSRERPGRQGQAGKNSDRMIRTIKFVVSVIFWTGLRIWHELLRLAGRRMPGTCIVLYYHAVSAEDRSRFARQMDILKKSAKPIAADAKGPLESGVHYAVVTFDDGFQSTAE